MVLGDHLLLACLDCPSLYLFSLLFHHRRLPTPTRTPRWPQPAHQTACMAIRRPARRARRPTRSWTTSTSCLRPIRSSPAKGKTTTSSSSARVRAASQSLIALCVATPIPACLCLSAAHSSCRSSSRTYAWPSPAPGWPLGDLSVDPSPLHRHGQRRHRHVAARYGPLFRRPLHLLVSLVPSPDRGRDAWLAARDHR